MAVPAFVVAPPRAHDDGLGAVDDVVAALPPEPLATPEPDIDFEAIAAQAQDVLDNAMRSADEIVAQAHERAAEIAADAQRAAVAASDEARRAGREAGYAAGVDEANAAMVSMIDTLRELVESVRNERHALLRTAEPELVRLAVGIAERVLHQQIALDHGVVVEMAKAAIARIVDRENITVRVNPVDVERMREHRDELLALGDVKTMRVIEDQRVDRGGVILETDGGNVDAKISTQLSEVRKILHIVDDIVVGPSVAAGDETDHAALPSVRAS